MTADLVPASGFGNFGDSEQSSYAGAFGEPEGNTGWTGGIYKASAATGAAAAAFGTLRMALLCNGNAADGDFPLLLSFLLNAGVNAAHLRPALRVNGFLSTGKSGASGRGVNAITFLADSSGPRKWNMNPQPGYAYPPSGSGTSGYTVLNVTAARLTPKTYFAWGGQYDPSTGAAL